MTGSRLHLARVAAAGVALAFWFGPRPEALGADVWHLFALFAAAIVSVVIGALPILTASVLALAGAVLTGVVTPADAYSGFGNPTILLIVVTFLLARAVINSGLSRRLGHLAIALFGRSTLGLSYGLFLFDALIAPAFPSNTARSGVLYPLVSSVLDALGVRPDREDRRRLGRFLMFSGIGSLCLSSGLWLTAMAANPIGADIARRQGAEVTFASWFLAASVPTFAGIALLPLLLYKIIRPEVTATREAPEAARLALRSLGPMSRREILVAATFVAMVLLWAAAGRLKIDAAAVAFLGLGIFLLTGVLTLADIAREGEVLSTFVWFAALFALSDRLNKMGFMEFLGGRLAMRLGGLTPAAASVAIVVAYVLIHYLFVSQTAHLLALFGVFLGVGIELGVSPAPLALQLLFATNYFSAITPQGSSANLLFAGSGYLSPGDIYRLGALTTAFCLVLYLVVGTPWLMFVAR